MALYEVTHYSDWQAIYPVALLYLAPLRHSPPQIRAVGVIRSIVELGFFYFIVQYSSILSTLMEVI